MGRRSVQDSRDNAKFCQDKADKLQAQGRVKEAATWSRAASDSRASADDEEYRDRHGGRSW